MCRGTSHSDDTTLAFCSPFFVDFLDIGVLVNIADFNFERFSLIRIGAGALQDMIPNELVIFKHLVDNADSFFIGCLHVLVLGSLFEEIDVFFDHFR
jgi:hypothetical protein